MNQIDRLLKVIHQVFPLSVALDFDRNSGLRTQDLLGYFDLNNESFREKITKIYLEEYRDTNQREEVLLILDSYKGKIKYPTPVSYPCNCLNFYRYVADHYLFYKAGQLTVSFDHLLEWNGIVDKVDPSILFAMKAALSSKEIEEDSFQRVQHDNDRLNAILSKGISENHMHLKGSGYTTEMSWHDFSISRRITFDHFEKILKDQRIRYEEKILGFYKARLIKLFLFQKLILEDKKSSQEKSASEDSGTVESERLTEQEMLYLFSAKNLDEYQYLVGRLQEKVRYLRERFEDYYKLNVLSGKFDIKKRSYVVERQYLTDIFRNYLNNRPSKFDVFVLNVYLLSMNQFRTFLYQTNIGMGFSKFKLSEDIKEDMLSKDRDTKDDTIRSTFDKYYSERNVKKVEFRIAPKTSVADYNKLLKKLHGINSEVSKEYGDRQLDYGVIVHLIKDKDDFTKKDGLSRKEKSLTAIKKSTDVLLQLFEAENRLREQNLFSEFDENCIPSTKIIGLDTANYEHNVRPEIFGPFFRKVRASIDQRRFFGLTYHVGEDYVTIANGLRAIDEVIEFLGYRRGDRLGHALALGLDIQQYFMTKRNKIHSTLEEYFDDIVWMYFFIKENRKIEDKESHEILQYLRDHFEEIKAILLETIRNEQLQKDGLAQFTLEDYYASYCLRGDDPTLYHDLLEMIPTDDFEEEYYKLTKSSECGLNDCHAYHKKSFKNQKARLLYYQYHYSKNFKKLHSEPFSQDASLQYIQAVAYTQLLLRRKVERLGICVECNPSSNRKISFVNKYIELPWFELNQSGLADRDLPDIPISINSDDSAIFQTDLSLEYAYVTATLLREGFKPEKVYQYIDYLREQSMQQSFIREK
ncbi:hypothetical protein [Streptococcus suis]|uniref:hypothetical protein n=1 Tax=Streptococcus suis TaxID=1307 RepID=UPI000CF67233|nr:hypothetical protein [Streptococcus suis]